MPPNSYTLTSYVTNRQKLVQRTADGNKITTFFPIEPFQALKSFFSFLIDI